MWAWVTAQLDLATDQTADSSPSYRNSAQVPAWLSSRWGWPKDQPVSGPSSMGCQRSDPSLGSWRPGLQGEASRLGSMVLLLRYEITDSQPVCTRAESLQPPLSWPCAVQLAGRGDEPGWSQQGTRLGIRQFPREPGPDGRERLTSLEEVKFALQIVEHLHC